MCVFEIAILDLRAGNFPTFPNSYIFPYSHFYLILFLHMCFIAYHSVPLRTTLSTTLTSDSTLKITAVQMRYKNELKMHYFRVLLTKV